MASTYGGAASLIDDLDSAALSKSLNVMQKSCFAFFVMVGS